MFTLCVGIHWWNKCGIKIVFSYFLNWISNLNLNFVGFCQWNFLVEMIKRCGEHLKRKKFVEKNSIYSIYGKNNLTESYVIQHLHRTKKKNYVHFKNWFIPSLIRFFLPNVPSLSQKLSSDLPLTGVFGDFGRCDAIFFPFCNEINLMIVLLLFFYLTIDELTFSNVLIYVNESTTILAQIQTTINVYLIPHFWGFFFRFVTELMISYFYVNGIFTE